MSETRETKPEYDEGRAKLSRLDKEIAEAIQEEADYIAQHEAEMKGTPFGQTAETRELGKLAGKGSIDRILRAAVRGTGLVGGPEVELQQHFDLDSNFIPLMMLMDTESRAAASFSGSGTPGTSPGISGQVFGDSASAFANVRFEDVPVGLRVHPVITTGALTAGVNNVSTPAKSAEVTETDAVLAVKELTPKRVQHGFSYTLEDAAIYPGLDIGFRQNLRAGLRDKVDEQILNRGTDGLLTFGTEPSSPSAESTSAAYLAAVASGVDGRFAMNEGEVKMLVGSTIYGHMAGQDVGTASGVTVTDKLGNRLRVSPHVPAYAGNFQEAVVCKGLDVQTRCAIWMGAEILVDQVSRAAHGEIRLHAVLMYDYAILREGGYTRHRFRNS